MTDVSAQLTLQTWMSAAFPTGAFSCSHGLETAIADGRIDNASSCHDWIAGIMQYGSGWNDSLFLCAAYSCIVDDPTDRATATSTATGIQSDACTVTNDMSSLNSINDLALALCTGLERRRETIQLGQAFARAAASPSTPSVLSLIEDDICLPVAVGAQGALSGIPVDILLPASLQASSSNLVWICTRLVPLGQSEALRIISSLQSLMIDIAQRASECSLDDLGSCALLADLASIEHEQLHSRICIT